MKKWRLKTKKELYGVVVLGCLLCATVFFEVHTDKSTVPVMLPVNDKIVVLDAGHGGWDPGTVGLQGETEKEINLKIMTRLQMLLEQGGAMVYITRTTDEALGTTKSEDMANRRIIADENMGDILVSVHQNAFSDATAKGAQVFYHHTSEGGKKLAEDIQSLLKTFADPDNQREAKSNDNYYILRSTTMPSVLVECGFLSNPEEERLLNTEEYQEKIAWSIYLGILEYFENVIE
ncbi:MAG: N-acetylmuramoyl-L-alanine amidase [Bacillota bacterium]